MIITRTPFRVSLAGGGSDLPVYYQNHGGAVVSFAINKYVYLSMHPLFNKDRFLVKYSKTEDVERVDEIQHRILRQVFSDYGIRGIDFNSSADIPAGTGLGSSSAFTVGLINLCNAYVGKYMTQEQMAAEACNIELNKLGEPIGKQDQYACSCGGLNLIRFHPDEQVTINKICLQQEQLKKLENNLFLFYTGVTRSASNILREQSESTRVLPDNSILLKKMVDLAEVLYQELSSGNTNIVGEVMHEGWMYKRELAGGITNPDLDACYDAAVKAGASGGKLLGAGGGGFFLFHVPDGRIAQVRNALSNLVETPFSVDREGTKIIYYGDSRINE